MVLRKLTFAFFIFILSASANASNNEPSENSLTITIEEAILLAMENNRSLVVQQMDPEIRRTYEAEERATFDPILGADISPRRTVSDRLSRAGSSTESQIVDSINSSVSIDKYFSSGTNLSLEGSMSYTDSSLYSDTFTSNRLGVTVTQALLEGVDVRANMARVHQASLDTLISEYELRGFTEVLLEEVELKFWDYALAQKQIEIYTNSLELAEQQMNEIEERINIGTLAEMELAAAQAAALHGGCDSAGATQRKLRRISAPPTKVPMRLPMVVRVKTRKIRNRRFAHQRAGERDEGSSAGPDDRPSSTHRSVHSCAGSHPGPACWRAAPAHRRSRSRPRFGSGCAPRIARCGRG